MEFKILGKTRLYVDGDEVALGSRVQRGLLSLLLYFTGKPVSVDLISRTLWPDSSSAEIEHRLQVMISRTRHVLNRSGSNGHIVKVAEYYRLELDPALVDYHRFRGLVDMGRAAAAGQNHVQAKEFFQEALGLWRDRPLQDLEGPWVEHCRDQMENFELHSAHYALLDSRLALREYAGVANEVGRLTREHRLDEEFARLYVEALEGLGEYARALEFYSEFSEHLQAVTGAQPSPVLRALRRQVMRKQANIGSDTQTWDDTAGSAGDEGSMPGSRSGDRLLSERAFELYDGRRTSDTARLTARRFAGLHRPSSEDQTGTISPEGHEVTVYTSGDDGTSVRDAVLDVLEAAGFAITALQSPEQGSWFQRLSAMQRDPDAAKRLATTVNEAVNNGLVSDTIGTVVQGQDISIEVRPPHTTREEQTANAVARLMEASLGHDEVVVYMRPILLIKVGSRITVWEPTDDEHRLIEDCPELLHSPRDLSAVLIAIAEQKRADGCAS